ncbi:MAG: hypothetical protein J6X59_00310 [Bacteroidales bacterium]|nr:hypothetical protein [Bacteroidales bacterium]
MAGIEYNPVTGEVTAVNHVRGRALDGGTDQKVGFMSVLIGGCCCKDNVILREVRLRFIREQLLYDIKNYAYVEHDIMPETNGLPGAINHARHQTADIGEEGNVDRVSRVLTLVMSEVVDMLYPYTKEAPVEEEVDDVLQVPISYEMLMRVPDTMSRTTIHYLCNLIHEYMVCRVLADWLLITNPQAASAWQLRAEAAKTEINSAKNQRRGPMVRKMYPF